MIFLDLELDCKIKMMAQNNSAELFSFTTEKSQYE